MWSREESSIAWYEVIAPVGKGGFYERAKGSRAGGCPFRLVTTRLQELAHRDCLAKKGFFIPRKKIRVIKVSFPA